MGGVEPTDSGVPRIPIPEDALQAIIDAYNNLGDAIEAAGLPRPPRWG